MLSATKTDLTLSRQQRLYGRLLLLVAGLGGLLYGVDVGIIGGALPYLVATAHLTTSQLSMVVAAVLLGSVLSTLFAGVLADAMGRRNILVLSGLAFIVSIPVIALSQSYASLFMGRVLQGMSGGLIGVVVPLYLAECLGADVRGKGAGLFQWLLTLGIFLAALIGIFYSYRVEAIQRLGDPQVLFQFQDSAWRHIFWASLPPGVLFVVGSFLLSESPRWLVQKRRPEQALQALLRSLPEAEARLELNEITAAINTDSGAPNSIQAGAPSRSRSLLQRKYVVPFLIACAVLFCNTATGINSIIGYNTNILLQSGLGDVSAHWGYVIFTALNFGMTVIGISLVDRRGRKFLLTLGTTGMLCALVATALLLYRTDRSGLDCRAAVQSSVGPNQTLDLTVDRAKLQQFLASSGHSVDAGLLDRASFEIVYSYGDFTNQTDLYRTDTNTARTIHIARSDAVPAGRTEAIFRDPFANLTEAASAPLVIRKAVLTRVPSSGNGWLVATSLFLFVSFYAVGPGVCVWLALSELMPTRIRSNGMSIALVLNQLVSTVLAAIFLPVVSRFGYSSLFIVFAGFSAIYFLVVTLVLPETKGRTLEEIEGLFAKAA